MKRAITLKVTLDIDDERLPERDDNDTVHEALLALLGALPERVNDTVVVHDARITEGYVDRDGVAVSTDG